MTNKLLWVVQSNLYNEDGYHRFIQSLEKMGCQYLVVKPVPFTDILLPESFDSATMNVEDSEDPITDDNAPMIAMGATTLTRISAERGWKPGTFLNSNFHYSKWLEGWGDNLLNSDSVVGRVSNLFVPGSWNHVFVRPTEDTKAISGTVMDREDFLSWQRQISQIEEERFTPLHRNTEVVVSTIKEIWCECRVFVVDGKPVTASMYKAGNRVFGNPVVDDRFTQFVEKLCNMWMPAEEFVVDIADTPEGLKVIEVNNLNSAGFYACDTDKIVNALEIKYGTA